MLLVVLQKAQHKVPHQLFGVCLMANHIHLLLRPSDATQLPKLMHWVAWYAAMLLNRLAGRCGHFWEARYCSTPIAPKDHKRALNTLRYIHANPKAAGVRKGFYDPYSNYGHYSRLETDGLTQWHPAFLQLAPTHQRMLQALHPLLQGISHPEQTSIQVPLGQTIAENSAISKRQQQRTRQASTGLTWSAASTLCT